jgi:DNA repair exonuclease SbcCD ATPase subunit
VIPIKLELHNFLAYRDPDPLLLEGIHVACLAGPNGAGKSSLLDAITWALWGKARTNSPDDLIHQGQSDMRVELTFDHEGQQYKVLRQRKSGKRGASILDLQGWDTNTESWKGLSEATIRGTQNRIEKLIRIDYETFVNSAFLVQGRADEFTMKTPNQRKEVLANILGLSVWDMYEDQAKEGTRANRENLNHIEGRLAEIERELNRRGEYEADLADAEGKAQNVASRLAEFEVQWANLEHARTQLVSNQRQIDDLTKRIVRLEKEVEQAKSDKQAAAPQADKEAINSALSTINKALDELEPLLKQQKELQSKQSNLVSDRAHLSGVNAALGPETEPIKGRVDTLQSATEPICPTCGQPLTEEHREELVQELQLEVDSRREQFKANRERIAELDADLSNLEQELKTITASLSERGDLERRVGELESALSHADETSERINRMESSISRWMGELDADRKLRAELEELVEKNEANLNAASISKDELEQLRLEKRLADEKVGGARQQLAAMDSLSEQRQRLLDERKTEAENLSLFEELQLAFSKRGVPAMIIETAVPELERSANELLNRMTDGRMAVRIETQREIKSGDLREALDIIISDELGTRSYDLYSGGESFRINFAIRIALSRLLARRAGAQLRSLFIDEGFGSQDARGREQLVAAINSIQDDFELILVITHIDEMKDAFPARIEVEKTPEGSLYRLS